MDKNTLKQTLLKHSSLRKRQATEKLKLQLTQEHSAIDLHTKYLLEHIENTPVDQLTNFAFRLYEETLTLKDSPITTAKTIQPKRTKSKRPRRSYVLQDILQAAKKQPAAFTVYQLLEDNPQFSKHTLRTYLKRLVEDGLLSFSRGGGQGVCNLYEVIND